MFIRVPALLFATCTLAQPVAVTDDLGRTVTLKAPAKRIATLAPFLTEAAFAVGAGGQVVAASAYSDYPPEARALPEVANAVGVAIETLAALKPDVALAWKDSIRAADVERLERLGIPVAVFSARRIDDVPRVLRQVAAVAGRDASGPASAFAAKVAALRARYAGRRRLTVLLEIWHQPLTTVAGPHTMNEALELCGARNAFDDLPGVAPVVPWEEVFRRDPDAIVVATSGGRDEAARASWASHRALRAVREGRVLVADADRLQRPGPRLADGIASLCAALEAARGS